MTRNATRTLPVLATLATLAVSLDASAITFGEADGDAHPAVGALTIEFEGGWGWPYCSGTLIDVDEDAGLGLFLTAGHCTADLEYYVDAGIITDFGVNFDEAPDFWSPIQYSATEVYGEYITDPVFTNWTDRGLLVFAFDDASALPEPATVADADFLDGFDLRELHEGTFVTVGYGATVDRMGSSYTYEDVRQQASPGFLNLIGNTVKTNQVGAAGYGGGCYADSGGPLYWVDEDGSEILVAVTQGGHKRCYSHGIYNRVDNDDALDFIDSALD